MSKKICLFNLRHVLFPSQTEQLRLSWVNSSAFCSISILFHFNWTEFEWNLNGKRAKIEQKSNGKLNGKWTEIKQKLKKNRTEMEQKLNRNRMEIENNWSSVKGSQLKYKHITGKTHWTVRPQFPMKFPFNSRSISVQWNWKSF